VSPHDVTCAEFVELVTDYLEDALDEEQRTALEFHMTYCTPCVVYLDQYRSAITAAARLREEAGGVPDQVLRGLVEAFRAVDRDKPTDN